MSSTGSISGVVLAGGRATRMGGQDKGLLQVRGRPMVEYVLDALRPQVQRLLINANRNAEIYGRYGCPVIADEISGFPGPLAGMASAMRHAESEYLVTAPCDSPLLPTDLVQRLAPPLRAQQAEICVAHGDGRMQPVFCMLRTDLLESLLGFLEGGGRKIDAWFAGHRTATADFSDCPSAFLNINSPDELRTIENLLGAPHGSP